MDEEEKARFISDIKYFWNEKGDLERYSEYSPEKLREADPVIANVYEQYKAANETLERLLGYGEQQ